MTKPSPRLRRSVLFVPGDDPKKIDRARDSAADSVVLDLEDAVPPTRKACARQLVASSLEAGGFASAEAAVRINPPGTPFFEDDVAAMRRAPTVMLPKSERADSIRSVDAQLAPKTRLLLLVETPLGVADALSVAASCPSVDAMCFGHADFSLQMGLSHADVANPLVQHARASIAIAAKARDLPPIDCVYIDVRDDAGFRSDTELGLSLGYEGRLCIHPRQAEIANEVYTPTAEQIRWAKEVIEGYEDAVSRGTGVFTMNGKLVDEPLVAQQRRLLARAQTR